jgi:hypothetical protein
LLGAEGFLELARAVEVDQAPPTVVSNCVQRLDIAMEQPSFVHLREGLGQVRGYEPDLGPVLPSEVFVLQRCGERPFSLRHHHAVRIVHNVGFRASSPTKARVLGEEHFQLGEEVTPVFISFIFT